MKELFDGYDGTGHESKFVSYGVTVPSGKIKGSLEMNYKFGKNLTGDTQKEMKDPAMACPSQGTYPPAVAYPAPSGYPQPAGNGYPQSAPNAYPDPTEKGHPPQANAYPPPGVYGCPAPSPNGYPVSGGYPAPQSWYPSQKDIHVHMGIQHQNLGMVTRRLNRGTRNMSNLTRLRKIKRVKKGRLKKTCGNGIWIFGWFNTW